MEENIELEFCILEDNNYNARQFVKHSKVEDMIPAVRYFDDINKLMDSVQKHEVIRVFWIDINLGQGKDDDGLEFIKWLRPRYPDALIIVHTAYEYFEGDCIKAGANHFSIKGQAYKKTMAEIQSIISKYLEGYGIVSKRIEFAGEVAHIDLEMGFVKLECFIESRSFEKIFPLSLLKAALRENLKIDARVKVRIAQTNAKVEISIEPLENSDDDEETDRRSLYHSKIWTNIIDNGSENLL